MDKRRYIKNDNEKLDVIGKMAKGLDPEGSLYKAMEKNARDAEKLALDEGLGYTSKKDIVIASYILPICKRGDRSAEEAACAAEEILNKIYESSKIPTDQEEIGEVKRLIKSAYTSSEPEDVSEMIMQDVKNIPLGSGRYLETTEIVRKETGAEPKSWYKGNLDLLDGEYNTWAARKTLGRKRKNNLVKVEGVIEKIKHLPIAGGDNQDCSQAA
jgi:hypothetical protein